MSSGLKEYLAYGALYADRGETMTAVRPQLEEIKAWAREKRMETPAVFFDIIFKREQLLDVDGWVEGVVGLIHEEFAGMHDPPGVLFYVAALPKGKGPDPRDELDWCGRTRAVKLITDRKFDMSAPAHARVVVGLAGHPDA